MKKGNKVLALFLAAVMLATSIAWDLSEVKAEETTETTSAITTTDDGVSIDFDNIDVAELDANGYVSTKFANGTPVKGEINQAVSKHWFSGDGEDTPYGKGETIKSKNVGLKTKDAESDNTKTVMYTPYSYEDFEVSAEIYYGAFSGIVFGEKNVYPDDASEATSVGVYFNGGRLHIIGAIENSTVKMMRGTSTATSNNGTTNGRFLIFNNGSGDTIGADAGGIYTVHVKKTGNHLLIWYSGGSGLIAIELADTYKQGWLGIQSKCYDGDGGGFKSLNINKVHATESYSLDNADMTDLDNKGYFATNQGNLKKDSIGDVFFSGETNGTTTTSNPGMKPITEDTNVAALNIPYVYKNFRLEAELYHGQLVGVAVGDATSYPRQSKMLSVFFNIYNSTVMLQLEGAYQSDTLTRVGGTSGGGTNKYQFRPTKAGTTSTTISGTKETVHTMVLEVRDGVMKVWLKGYDGYLTAKVSSTYKTDKISLIARKPKADGGGFKSYTITNLDAGDSADFDNVNLHNLTAAGYTASDCADSEFKDKAVSEVWFSGESGYSASEANKNDGLKPNDTTVKDGNIDLLNLPKVYENFRLKTTMYHGQVVGVAIGKKGVKPSASSGTDNGVVTIYTNSKYIELRGAINKSSVNLTAGSEETNNSNLYHYVPVGHSADWNKEKTLVVEMQDGILTVWMEGYAGILRVRVTDNYAAGNIALIARRPDTDGVNAGGGLKGYTIEKLPATNNINTTADVEGYTDFDFVDTTVLDAKRFNVSQFSTDGTVVATDAAVGTHMYAGEVGISSAGNVAYNKEYPNSGLKAKSLIADSKQTVLNTPYGYESFRVSTEVYWGASTGIVLGEKNVFPTGSSVGTSVRIYFNQSQLQLIGGGFDFDSAQVTGNTATWDPNWLATNDLAVFKPASSYASKKGAVYKLNVEFIDGTFTMWLDGFDGALTIKASDEFLALEDKAIGLMMRGYDGDCGGLKSLQVDEIENLTIPYTAAEFATYRSEKGHTAPTYNNYLFAGWFTDPACTLDTAVSSSAITTDEKTVYAKFVLRDILTVKAQVSAELLDEDLANDTKGNIRFVTTVDSLNYSQAGFEISYDKDGDGKATPVTKASNTVYKTISAIGGTVYEPTDFCNSSIYFKASTVKNVGESYYDLDFTVTPFWKTLDGTVVTGETVVKTVNQGMDFEYLTGKSALFLGDSIMKGAEDYPANDFKHLSWAGRLDRYYGMNVDKVAQSGWALTSDCPESSTSTTIRGQIVTQMRWASEDSYDYVILEGGCNDVLTYTNFDQTVIQEKWGTIQTADDAVLDDTTIAGAMQDLIVQVHSKYPNAKLIYIINSEYGLFDADQANIYNNEAKLTQMIKDVCMLYKEKGYDINYIDLSNTTVYPELSALSLENTNLKAEYLPDSLHPNAASYELSTPIIANFLREVGTGKLPEEVYLSSDGSLNAAIDEVVDGGTVYVQGTYAITSNNWVEHGKQVTITSAPGTSATIDLSTLGTLYAEDAVIFDNITLQFSDSTNGGIMARGHALAVNDDVTFTGKSIKIYGGKDGSVNVDSTQLRLYAGNYTEIYGGGSSGNVKYDTNIIIGSKVNDTVDSTSHDENSYLVFGGVRNGVVNGNTYITVQEGANFHYIFGGSRDGGSVNGSTNIKFAGNTYGIYGGSWKGTVSDTHVEILGGTVGQVFGGCRATAMTGNTDVKLLGGTVTRRVYGGCYNEYGTSWTTSHFVTGYTNVTIGPNVTLALNEDASDRGVFAGSRYKSAFDGEVGTVLFVDGSYSAQESALGSQDFTGSLVVGTPEYNYCVKATTGGTVTSANGKLVVTPNSDYTASVEGATDNNNGTYTLPESGATITVTFAPTN